MAYSGKFQPIHTHKYKGDSNKIVFRSLWERQVFVWCDSNPGVLEWSSEEVIVPYVCRSDGKPHRYFVDLYVKLENGNVLLIEIKPHVQTQKPVFSKRKKQSSMLVEAVTYAKNVSKWEAAEEYCRKRGWMFQIWTEKTLASLGIKIAGTADKGKR